MEDLTESDYKSFVRLSGNKEFLHWKGIIDKFQLTRAMNLISAMPAEGVEEEDILKNFRGGYQLWKKATDLIAKADTIVAEKESINEEKITLFGEEIEFSEEESRDDIS